MIFRESFKNLAVDKKRIREKSAKMVFADRNSTRRSEDD
jgi:hypothetical protein|nr:MAG TPA: hypothetical protein [Caudoviricetes sp.]